MIAAAVGAVAPQAWTELPDFWPVQGVRDSKKTSTNQRAEILPRLLDFLHQEGAGVGVGVVSVDEINKSGYAFAMEECKARAVRLLIEDGFDPDMLIVDGTARLQRYRGPQRAVPRADGIYWVVAAASIIAKVARDKDMAAAALKYPGYGWERNMGYTGGSRETSVHVHGLRTLGLTPLHRVQACQTVLSKG